MPDLDWMAWTPGTAVFVVGVFAGLAGLAAAALRWPSSPRKGFLPMVTARGDRVYVGALGVGLVLVLALALTTVPVPVALVPALAWLAVVLRWG